ncbi:MAG: hypothetical protein R2880_18710 [Deinococcales bacterium]
MMRERLLFLASLVFLLGIVLVIGSPLAKNKSSTLLGYGFLLAILGIILAVGIAFLLPIP